MKSNTDDPLEKRSREDRENYQFHKLRNRERRGDWFWDFHTYVVDSHIEMAYIDTSIPYDIFNASSLIKNKKNTALILNNDSQLETHISSANYFVTEIDMYILFKKAC